MRMDESGAEIAAAQQAARHKKHKKSAPAAASPTSTNYIKPAGSPVSFKTTKNESNAFALGRAPGSATSITFEQSTPTTPHIKNPIPAGHTAVVSNGNDGGIKGHVYDHVPNFPGGGVLGVDVTNQYHEYQAQQAETPPAGTHHGSHIVSSTTRDQSPAELAGLRTNGEHKNGSTGGASGAPTSGSPGSHGGVTGSTSGGGHIDHTGQTHNSVGQVAPGHVTPRASGSTYTYQPGDTEQSIAAANHISVGELHQLNPHVQLNKLKPGETLLVNPAGGHLTTEQHNVVVGMANAKQHEATHAAAQVTHLNEEIRSTNSLYGTAREHNDVKAKTTLGQKIKNLVGLRNRTEKAGQHDEQAASALATSLGHDTVPGGAAVKIDHSHKGGSQAVAGSSGMHVPSLTSAGGQLTSASATMPDHWSNGQTVLAIREKYNLTPEEFTKYNPGYVDKNGNIKDHAIVGPGVQVLTANFERYAHAPFTTNPNDITGKVIITGGDTATSITHHDPAQVGQNTQSSIPASLHAKQTAPAGAATPAPEISWGDHTAIATSAINHPAEPTFTDKFSGGQTVQALMDKYHESEAQFQADNPTIHASAGHSLRGTTLPADYHAEITPYGRSAAAAVSPTPTMSPVPSGIGAAQPQTHTTSATGSTAPIVGSDVPAAASPATGGFAGASTIPAAAAATPPAAAATPTYGYGHTPQDAAMAAGLVPDRRQDPYSTGQTFEDLAKKYYGQNNAPQAAYRAAFQADNKALMASVQAPTGHSIWAATVPPNHTATIDYNYTREHVAGLADAGQAYGAMQNESGALLHGAFLDKSHYDVPKTGGSNETTGDITTAGMTMPPASDPVSSAVFNRRPHKPKTTAAKPHHDE